MKNLSKYFIFYLVFLLMVFPLWSFAQSTNTPIVPCGDMVDANGKIINPCDFNGFIDLVNNVIKYALFTLALPIAAIMIAYAGIKLVISGGDTEARGAAKRILTNTIFGLIIAVAAYLIVGLILSTLSPGAWQWIGFN